MKSSIIFAAVALVNGNEAEKSGYGAPPLNKAYFNEHVVNDAYHYVPPGDYRSYGAAYEYGEQPPAGYGYSPYEVTGSHYKGYDKYENYVEPVYPQKTKPNPFVDYPKEKHNNLRIPKLAKYHCFLNGAPWTKCGRKTLTSYFLEQCMSFYFSMSTSVDGICGGKAASHSSHAYDVYGSAPHAGPDYGYYMADKAEKGENYYAQQHAYGPQPASHYGHYPQQAPAPYAPYHPPQAAQKYPEPAPAPAPTGYSGAVIPEYQKERCLQRSFVAITTAVVLCLTENIIRIKYIEHYAEDAAKNPIEGPILYLKKLHAFIREVLSCTGESNAAGRFPNLWSQFSQVDTGVSYSPDLPYEVPSGGTSVQLPQSTSKKSVGWDTTTANGYFLCTNTEDLGGGPSSAYYIRDNSNIHYSSSILDSCPTATSAAIGILGNDDAGRSNALKKCPHLVHGPMNDGPVEAAFIAEPAGEGEPIGHAGQHYADLTLAGLYQAVNTAPRQTQSAFRLKTIAEIATQNHGTLGQPILEGFGIMYFCAFFACKANNGGDLDGTCFPKFDCDKDYEVPSDMVTIDEINELGDKVEYCLEHKWLVKEDVTTRSAVTAYQTALDRSYICMAEKTVVDFFIEVLGTPAPLSAAYQVYLRHFAVEKCYESDAAQQYCVTDGEVYEKLKTALTDLVGVCKTRKDEYLLAKENHGSSHYYGGHHYGGGYHA